MQSYAIRRNQTQSDAHRGSWHLDSSYHGRRICIGWWRDCQGARRRETPDTSVNTSVSRWATRGHERQAAPVRWGEWEARGLHWDLHRHRHLEPPLERRTRSQRTRSQRTRSQRTRHAGRARRGTMRRGEHLHVGVGRAGTERRGDQPARRRACQPAFRREVRVASVSREFVSPVYEVERRS